MTLLTGFGRYLRCDSCHYAWQEARGDSETSAVALPPLLFAFDVQCPNGHVTAQQFAEQAIRKGGMPLHCHRCRAIWTSTHDVEARVLRDIAEYRLRPEVAIG